MTDHATKKVSSLAATVGARSAAHPTTWPLCPSAVSIATTTVTRVRMQGNGNAFLTTRRQKDRSSP